ncbi:MAG TPA: hypothetical protein PLD46_05555 [Hyphomicrobium sp.]|nr:hypothetical protein [Hyphomicrobium sp.]
MIGTDVLQRLLSVTVLLKSERTLREIGTEKVSVPSANSQPSNGKSVATNASTSLVTQGQRHFTQASSWPTAPIMSDDAMATAPLPMNRLEAAAAPVRYLETVAEGAVAPRPADQPPAPLGIVQPQIFYATAEIAHALSRTTGGIASGTATTSPILNDSSQTRETMPGDEKQALKRTIYIAMAGAISATILALVLAVL